MTQVTVYLKTKDFYRLLLDGELSTKNYSFVQGEVYVVALQVDIKNFTPDGQLNT